jgi:hypothetical protein
MKPALHRLPHGHLGAAARQPRPARQAGQHRGIMACVGPEQGFVR